MLAGNARFPRKRKQASAQIVVAQEPSKPFGVTLLLLSLPWAEEAILHS